MKDKDTKMLEEAYGEFIQPNKSIHDQRVERQNQINKSKDDQDILTVAYLDDDGHIVIIGEDAFRNVSWVDSDRAIPNSWQPIFIKR